MCVKVQLLVLMHVMLTKDAVNTACRCLVTKSRWTFCVVNLMRVVTVDSWLMRQHTCAQDWLTTS